MKLAKKLIVSSLVVGILSGCGSTSGGTTNSDIVTEITEPVEITFWHAMNGAQEESLTKLTEQFMAENENITVTLQNQSSYADLQQKLTATQVSPENLPTLTQAYPDWMLNAVNDGLVLALDEYITNETIGFDDYEDIVEGFREATIFGDQTYAIPFNKSTEVLWYNKTLLDELGLEAPTTLEELTEVSKTIQAEKGIAGAGFDSLSNYYTTYITNEGEVYNNEFDVTGQASQDAVNYYLDGIKDGYFRIAGTDKYLSGPFASETVAMYIGSNAGESFVTQGVDGKFEVGVAPFPATNKIQQGTDLYVFDSATAEQKTAAFEYLKFVTTAESQLTWATDTGYVPVRTSVLESDEYKTNGSLVTPILEEATQGLFTNPVVEGANAAYKESSTMLEGILADPTVDVTEKLEAFKTSLASIW
ncbi:MAG: ABC transporter substrate-binding protein [Culicoidibacterales bacterium]